jgi:predicted kinase
MYAKVFKFNPNHDAKNGQFTSGSGGSSGPTGTAHGRKTLRGIKGNIGNFPRDNRPVSEVVAAIKSHLPQDQLDAADRFDKQVADALASGEETVKKYATQKGTDSAGNPIYEWSPERQALHQKIVDEFFADADKYVPPKGVAPEFVALGGRGGSGKSQLTNPETTPIKDIGKFKVLDPDEIKGKLPGYNGANAALFHEESSMLTDKILYQALMRGMNMVQDVTMKSKKGVQGALDTAHRYGYKLQGHYMHLPAEIAGQRAMARATGRKPRYVPLEIIAGNKDNEKNFQELVNDGYFSSWSVWDNNVPQGQKAKLVAKRP